METAYASGSFLFSIQLQYFTFIDNKWNGIIHTFTLCDCNTRHSLGSSRVIVQHWREKPNISSLILKYSKCQTFQIISFVSSSFHIEAHETSSCHFPTINLLFYYFYDNQHVASASLSQTFESHTIAATAAITTICLYVWFNIGRASCGVHLQHRISFNWNLNDI